MKRTTNHFDPKDFTKKVKAKGIIIELYDTIDAAYTNDKNRCNDYTYADIEKCNNGFSSRERIRFYKYQDGTNVISVRKDERRTLFYRVP